MAIQSKGGLEKLLGILEPKLAIRGVSYLPCILSLPCSVIGLEQLVEEIYLHVEHRGWSIMLLGKYPCWKSVRCISMASRIIEMN